jgi:uncharacterized protein (DUF1330 family)
MAAYVIVKAEVTRPDQYKEYMKLTPVILEKYNGRFIVRGGQTLTLEGPEETRRMVMLEFPSMEKAREWYYSKEYQGAKKVREGAALASFVAVEGV